MVRLARQDGVLLGQAITFHQYGEVLLAFTQCIFRILYLTQTMLLITHTQTEQAMDMATSGIFMRSQQLA